MSLRVRLDVEVSRSGLMQALRDATLNDENFDHRQWSIWDAECLEAVARNIRDGYKESESLPRNP